MLASKGFAAPQPNEILAPFNFERRELEPNDVLIEILYSGVCHSDIHQARDEWGKGIFPMVPGHEVVGRITQVGSAVSKFNVGELAGVGCFVDSCRTCPSCQQGLEQYCETGMTPTYNGKHKDGTPTYGGYSNNIVVDEQYVLHVSEKLDIKRVAPLLCAGITTYSPLMHWKVGKGHNLAVVGLGGLGHMAVKFGVALGAEVTVISTSANKEKDAKALGAHHFIVSKDKAQFKSAANSFDYILDTVSANHDVGSYLNLLRLNGTMIMVGIPTDPAPVSSMSLVGKRRSLVGSLIGGIAETQEMLDYCAEHNIMSDVEIIDMDYINEAYERMIAGDVHYRFVIDMASL